MEKINCSRCGRLLIGKEAKEVGICLSCFAKDQFDDEETNDIWEHLSKPEISSKLTKKISPEDFETKTL